MDDHLFFLATISSIFSGKLSAAEGPVTSVGRVVRARSPLPRNCQIEWHKSNIETEKHLLGLYQHDNARFKGELTNQWHSGRKG